MWIGFIWLRIRTVQVVYTYESVGLEMADKFVTIWTHEGLCCVELN